VACLAGQIGTPTIDSSFTLGPNANGVSGQNVGSSFAYQLQTAATTRNPTWTWTGSSSVAAGQASFK
jgi:hypothetical protein